MKALELPRDLQPGAPGAQSQLPSEQVGEGGGKFWKCSSHQNLKQTFFLVITKNLAKDSEWCTEMCKYAEVLEK